MSQIIRSGNVRGPNSSTDNAIVRFDGTTGKLVQDSSPIISDLGYIGVGTSPSHFMQVRVANGVQNTYGLTIAVDDAATKANFSAVYLNYFGSEYAMGISARDGSIGGLLIDVQGDTVTNGSALRLSNTSSMTQKMLDVRNSGTGNGVHVDQDADTGTNSATDGALFVDNTGNNDHGLVVYSNMGATANKALAQVFADNTAFDQSAFAVRQDGAGRSIDVDQNGNTQAIFIDHDDTGTSASIDIDRDGNNAGTITGLKINTANAGAGTARALWVEAGTSQFDAAVTVPDEAYGSGWNGSLEVPTKNAVYDKIELINTQGADVASANNLSLGADGDVFEITGTTQVNLISNIGWKNGSRITLLFTSTPTVKHNQTTSTTNITIQLAGAVDFVASAGDTLTLVLSEISGVQSWREICRTVI